MFVPAVLHKYLLLLRLMHRLNVNYSYFCSFLLNVHLLSFSHLPKIYQSFLMSATLSEDVQSLKELLLHNPVI